MKNTQKTSREYNTSRALAKGNMEKLIEETIKNSSPSKESIIEWNLFTKDNLPQPNRPLLLHFGNEGKEPRVCTGKMKVYSHNRTFSIHDEDKNDLALSLIIAWAYIESLPEEILDNKNLSGSDDYLPDNYETTESNELRKRTVMIYGESCTQKAVFSRSATHHKEINGCF